MGGKSRTTGWQPRGKSTRSKSSTTRRRVSTPSTRSARGGKPGKNQALDGRVVLDQGSFWRQVETKIQNTPQTSCEIRLLLTVRLLAFQVCMLLNITYLIFSSSKIVILREKKMVIQQVLAQPVCRIARFFAQLVPFFGSIFSQYSLAYVAQPVFSLSPCFLAVPTHTRAKQAATVLVYKVARLLSQQIVKSIDHVSSYISNVKFVKCTLIINHRFFKSNVMYFLINRIKRGVGECLTLLSTKHSCRQVGRFIVSKHWQAILTLDNLQYVL